MDDNLVKIICDKIDSATGKLKELSDFIFSHPELGFQEVKAHDYVTRFLKDVGGFTQVEENYLLPTAFRAEYSNGEGPTVCIVCEYDALPNVGHACGHNLICELGVGASLAVRYLLERGDIKGRLVVLGTPAEEGGGGKVDLINAGALQGIDCAMMCHPFSTNILYPVMLSTRKYTLRYRGVSAHAAASPWQGTNALDAAVQFYIAISTLRQQIKPEQRIHVIIIKGGDAINIIPEYAELQVMMRAVTEADLDVLERKVTCCMESAATSTGCTWDREKYFHHYQNVHHNHTLGDVYASYFRNIARSNFADAAGGDGDATGGGGDIPPSGSTDMGNMSHVVPSIHPKFSINTSSNIHTKEFAQVANRAETQGYALAVAKSLACTAARVFSDTAMVERMKEEFNSSEFT